MGTPASPLRHQAPITSMSRPLVTVIGAGNVGATTAQRIAEAGLADVVLVDIVEGLPQGKGLGLAQAAPAAGRARQRGMSRDDLLLKNAGIVDAVVRQAAPRSPDAILIVVTNPLDAMC